MWETRSALGAAKGALGSKSLSDSLEMPKFQLRLTTYGLVGPVQVVHGLGPIHGPGGSVH